MADLSAFPLLRLDQLGQLDTPTLQRSLAELPGLVCLDGRSNHHEYVARQRQAIELELEKRRRGRPPAAGPCQVWRGIGLPTTTATSKPAASPPKPPPAAAAAPKARSRAPAAGPVEFVIQAAPRRVAASPSSPSARPSPLTSLKRRRRMALERLQRFMEARRQAEGGEVPTPDRCEKGDDGSGSGRVVPVECAADKAAAKEPDEKDGVPMLLPRPPPSPPPPPAHPIITTDCECDCLAAFPTLASLVQPHRPPSTTARLSAAHLEQADKALRQHLAASAYAEKGVYVELGTASRPEVAAIVADVLRARLPGWRPLLPVDDCDEEKAGNSSPGPWNVLWSWGNPRLDYGALLAFQRVNHIPNSRQLTRKDLLARHLDRLLGPAAASSAMPRTFALPQDYIAFVACFATGSRTGGHARSRSSSTTTSDRNDVWIIKSVESSRGRGIRLVDDVAQVLYTEPSIIQRYVPDPLLLRGRYKFDLRLYVLVTAFQPRLEAFIYREGFARLCTRPFTLDCLTDPLVHLSNSSVQRRALRGHDGAATMAEDHPLRTAPAAHVGGSKLRLSYLLEELLQEEEEQEEEEEHGGGVSPAMVWERTKALVLTSLVAVADSVPACPHGFELFGYDVLLDSALRPWLLEVNASPSLAREHPLDAEIKEALVHDTLRLVDPMLWDRRALHDVLARWLGPAAGPSYMQQQCDSGRRRAASGGTRLRSGPNAALSVEDLHRILGGRHRPRQPGEEVAPEQLGQYERLCPDTKLYQQAVANKRRGKQQRGK